MKLFFTSSENKEAKLAQKKYAKLTNRRWERIMQIYHKYKEKEN